MNKTWLVFLHEYKRHVFRKRFIFALLSMPFFTILIILISFLSVWLQFNTNPAGFVDPGGVLIEPQQAPAEEKDLFKPVLFINYIDESKAREAFDRGEIQSYFMISPDYLDTGDVKQISGARTGNNLSAEFGNFMIYNILKGAPEPIIERINEGNNLIIRSLDGKREMALRNWLSLVMPILAGVLFIVVVNISGNYLLQAVVEEKENRTIEILVTSVSPGQLMGGKVLGNLLVGLTQLVIWILFAVVALKIAPLVLPIDAAPSIDASYLLLMAGTLLPAFVMVAAAMGAIGATATETREAQQIAGLFTIPLVIPLWFITAIIFNPNGPIALGLSLFPLTAPIALPMRAVFTPVPAWQIIMVITSLCLLAVFAIWLSGRIFRLGMLRYGKKVRFREAFSRSRQS